MNAALLYNKEDLRLETIPEPKIHEGELLFKTATASICGTDLRMWKNGHAFATPEKPLVIGHEMSGTIAQVGPGVTGYKTGQRVCIAPNYNTASTYLTVAGEGHLDPNYRALGIHDNGSFAEYVRIPREAVLQGNVFPIADHVSFAAAALAEPLSCVYNAYEKARTGPGDVVLIVGAGPIGVMHAKLSKLAGAGKVIVNDRHDDRLALVRSIDPSFITISGNPAQELSRLTNGRGADVVITACSNASTQTQAIELAAVNGRVILFGGLPKGNSMVPLDTNLIHYKQLIVTATTRQSLRQFQKTLDLLTEGVLMVDDLVTTTYRLSEIPKVFAGNGARGLKTRISFE